MYNCSSIPSQSTFKHELIKRSNVGQSKGGHHNDSDTDSYDSDDNNETMTAMTLNNT